jgi:hypothetical protein
VGLALLLILTTKRQRRARLQYATVWLLAILFAGCSGLTGAGSNPPPAAGTPAGRSTLTITATSGSLSHSATFSLTVN